MLYSARALALASVTSLWFVGGCSGSGGTGNTRSPPTSSTGGQGATGGQGPTGGGEQGKGPTGVPGVPGEPDTSIEDGRADSRKRVPAVSAMSLNECPVPSARTGEPDATSDRSSSSEAGCATRTAR